MPRARQFVNVTKMTEAQFAALVATTARLANEDPKDRLARVKAKQREVEYLTRRNAR